MVLLALALLAAQEKPPALKFAMQHDTGAKDGRGARKLKPDEEQALAREFRALPAFKEVAVKDGQFTLTPAPGSSLRLSELRGAGKKAPVAEGFHQIVLNTLRLEGKVTLHLQVEKNREKVRAALKGGRVEAVEEAPDGWTCTIKAPGVDIPGLIKAVCQACGLEYRLFDVLKDVTWHF
jgi:hypothetical protein